MNSGTLKALGYNDRDIIKKFTIYGFIASILGAISDLPVVKEDINTNNKMRLRGIYVCRNV